MQLEVKIVLDLGDDVTTPTMNDAFRMFNERLTTEVLNPVCNLYGGKATTHMGWTSSGDDEE